MDEFKKIFKGIVIGIIILIIVLATLTLLNIVTFVSIFNWVQHGIYRVTGCNPVLARFFAATILAVFVALPLGSIVKSFTPLPQKNKGAFRSIIFIALSVVFLFIFFGGKKTFFDPQTGEPIKYYIQYPNGKYKISTESGYDQVTGEKLKLVTKEIALKLAGLNEEPESIQPVESFTPIETEPPPAIKSEPEIVATSESTPAYECDPIKPVKKVPIKPKKEAVIEVPHEPEVSESPMYRPFKENYDTEPAKKAKEEDVEIDDNETNGFKETVRQVYREAKPLVANEECRVEFHNFSLNSIIVANFSKMEIAKVSFESDATLYLKPGKYYFKFKRASSWNLFIVPDNGSCMVNIDKRVKNNNHVGDEIPAVIHRYYGNTW